MDKKKTNKQIFSNNNITKNISNNFPKNDKSNRTSNNLNFHDKNKNNKFTNKNGYVGNKNFGNNRKSSASNNWNSCQYNNGSFGNRNNSKDNTKFINNYKNFQKNNKKFIKGKEKKVNIKKFILKNLILCSKFKNKYFRSKKSFYLFLNLVEIIIHNFEYLNIQNYINQYEENIREKFFIEEQIYRFVTYFIQHLFNQFNLLQSISIKTFSFSLAFLKNYYNNFSLKDYMIDYARYLYLKNKLEDKFDPNKFYFNKIDNNGEKGNNTINEEPIMAIEDKVEYKKKFFTFFIRIYKKFIRKGLSRKMIIVWLQALSTLKFRYKDKYIIKFFNCLENIRPLVRFFQMRIGGKKYQIPVFISKASGCLTAMRWLSNFSRARGATVTKNLINLLELSIKNSGPVIKYRNDQFSFAIANKNYIRFLRFLKH